MLQVADPHYDLSCERAGHCLPQCHAVQEVLSSEPPPLLDKVPLHIANCRDGASKAPRTQAEEVPHVLTQAWLVAGWGFARTRFRRHSAESRRRTPCAPSLPRARDGANVLPRLKHRTDVGGARRYGVVASFERAGQRLRVHPTAVRQSRIDPRDGHPSNATAATNRSSVIAR